MIYYVEDDANIRELVVYTLTQTGLPARGFAGAEEFYAACKTELPKLVLLDIMLAGDDGLKILKRLKEDRATSGIPVLMVTAKGMEYDRVLGLDSGADDYIVKPFGMMELTARVRAHLRRTGALTAEDTTLSCGELALDVRAHSVTVGGKPVELTLKEYELLRLLMGSAHTAFTREQLLERIWDYGYEGGTRTVDVHIQTLRAKLGGCGSMIETVRGVGYRFGGDV